MKNLLQILLILFLPTVVLGQPYDSVDKFNGEIKKVIQKEIGRDVYFFKRPILFLPNTYSGWKYKFSFNNNLLTRRINKQSGKLRADYLYTYDTIEQRIIKRDIWNCDINDNRGDYMETEWVYRKDINELKEIKTSSYYKKTASKVLSSLETDFKYKQDDLIESFKRLEYNMKGELIYSSYYTYVYDSLNRIENISITDLDIKDSVNILTGWTYSYDRNYLRIDKKVLGADNKNGEIIHSDLFKLDKYGNWIKWFIIIDGEKKSLKSKRTIRYK